MSKIAKAFIRTKCKSLKPMKPMTICGARGEIETNVFPPPYKCNCLVRKAVLGQQVGSCRRMQLPSERSSHDVR